jgi:hypothetical protein
MPSISTFNDASLAATPWGYVIAPEGIYRILSSQPDGVQWIAPLDYLFH